MVFVTGQVCLTFMFSKFLGLSFYVKPNITYPWQVMLGTDFFFFSYLRFVLLTRAKA